MIRIAIILIWIANIAWAQNFGGLARIDLEQSDLSMDGDDFVIDLQLDQTVPYRVFTLNDPKRAVLEFREIDWQDTPTDAFAQDGSVQFGNTSNGWSRIVVGLSKPMIVSEAGMTGFRAVLTRDSDTFVPLADRMTLARDAGASLMNAADFASVLVEVGFLSSPRDREMLSSNNGRAPLVAGLVNAVQRWAVDEAARAPLVRQ